MTRSPLKREPNSSHSVLLRWAGRGYGRRLLDVGSAKGDLADRFRAQGWKVTTLDREGSPDILADLNVALPTGLGPFDSIVCADVIEHLDRPEDVLWWARGLLLIEGRMLISVPNIAHAWARWQLARGRWPQEDCGIFDRTHRHWFTQETLETLLQGVGLRTIRATVTPAPVELLWPWWPPRAQAWHARLARGWPRLFGYQLLRQCGQPLVRR